MATQFEYRLVELAGEVRGGAFNLDSFQSDSILSELRRDGWELASTGLSVRRHSEPFTNAYTIRITYGLRRPLTPKNVKAKERPISTLLPPRNR